MRPQPFDREKIARHGLTIEDVQTVISSALGGEELTTTVEGKERYRETSEAKAASREKSIDTEGRTGDILEEGEEAIISRRLQKKVIDSKIPVVKKKRPVPRAKT